MIPNKSKQCLLIFTILPSLVHGLEPPIQEEPPNAHLHAGQDGDYRTQDGGLDKGHHRNQHRLQDKSSIIEKTEENNASAKQKRHRRNVDGKNSNVMLQFDRGWGDVTL